MSSAGEDPSLWQVLAGAIGKTIVVIVIGIGTLISWLGNATYRRLSSRITDNSSRIDELDRHVREMPSRSDLDNLRQDIRDLRQHIDNLWSGGK